MKTKCENRYDSKVQTNNNHKKKQQKTIILSFFPLKILNVV